MYHCSCFLFLSIWPSLLLFAVPLSFAGCLEFEAVEMGSGGYDDVGGQHEVLLSMLNNQTWPTGFLCKSTHCYSSKLIARSGQHPSSQPRLLLMADKSR